MLFRVTILGLGRVSGYGRDRISILESRSCFGTELGFRIMAGVGF